MISQFMKMMIGEEVKIYKLYVYTTTKEYFFSRRAIANKVKKSLEAEGEPYLELTPVDLDPKFFTHPSINKKEWITYGKD